MRFRIMFLTSFVVGLIQICRWREIALTSRETAPIRRRRFGRQPIDGQPLCGRGPLCQPWSNRPTWIVTGGFAPVSVAQTTVVPDTAQRAATLRAVASTVNGTPAAGLP